MRLRYLPHLSGKVLEAPSFDLVSIVDVGLRPRDFDVIYLLGYGMSLLVPIMTVRGLPVLLNTDGLEWKRTKWNPVARWWMKRAEKTGARVATALGADSYAVADHFQQSYGVASHYVGNGADAWDPSPSAQETLARHGVRPGEYATLVCRLEPDNNVELLIRGYLEADVPAPLLVIGGATYRSEYVQNLLRFASDRIRFLGTIYDKRELMDLRFHAQLYLHGHEVGGTNPSLLEAMGCGNAVIATDNRFNAEVLGGTGVLVTKSTAAVAAAVRRLAADPAERGRLGAAARSRQLADYSWDRTTELHELALQATIASFHSNRR